MSTVAAERAREMENERQWKRDEMKGLKYLNRSTTITREKRIKRTKYIYVQYMLYRSKDAEHK